MSKPITKSIRAERRKDAEARDVIYNKLNYIEKLSRAGNKQRVRLLKKGN